MQCELLSKLRFLLFAIHFAYYTITLSQKTPICSRMVILNVKTEQSVSDFNRRLINETRDVLSSLCHYTHAHTNTCTTKRVDICVSTVHAIQWRDTVSSSRNEGTWRSKKRLPIKPSYQATDDTEHCHQMCNIPFEWCLGSSMERYGMQRMSSHLQVLNGSSTHTVSVSLRKHLHKFDVNRWKIQSIRLRWF